MSQPVNSVHDGFFFLLFVHFHIPSIIFAFAGWEGLKRNNNILRGTHVVVLGALGCVGSGLLLPPPLPLPLPPAPPPSWFSASSPAPSPSPQIHPSFVLPLRLPGPRFMMSVLSLPPGPTFLAPGPTLFPVLGRDGRRPGTRTDLSLWLWCHLY